MRFLVVEDDRLLNNTLCCNLSAAGYTVDAALAGEPVIFTPMEYRLLKVLVRNPQTVLRRRRWAVFC